MDKEVDLSKRRSSFLINHKEETATALEFDYSFRQGLRYRIIEALVFWKFVANVIDNCYKYSPLTDWEKRQEILSQFVGDKNPYVGLVAALESLPTSVWQKVLWEDNIDFMSFESFLRRIDDDQIRRIRKCYKDLYIKHEVPGIFGWFERWRKGITLEKILEEPFVFEDRYQSKGSWSYDLMGWGFGFNAYPKGVTDDTKVVEISPLRFLSVKEHADDFIVNTKDGWYWWLYRTARSNYLLFPNKEVELKNPHLSGVLAHASYS